MWIIAAVILIAIVLLIAAVRAVFQRRQNSQRLLMRDHLNRISRDWEDPY
jgi:hypothetical protein